MIKFKEVSYKKFIEIFCKGTVYFYNDYEDIVYKGVAGNEKERTRYFAKIVGRRDEEFEVFTETSNCLMEAMMQPLIITKEDYDRA